MLMRIFLTHKVFIGNSCGFSNTPIMETFPPALTASRANSYVPLAPTASMVRSAPRPSVIRGADRTIEAVGAKGTYELALDAVRAGGNVSIIGVFEKPQELPMNTLWVKNIRISMGLVNANHIPELIRLVQNKKIDMKFLCTHHAPLNDLLKGYDVFGNKKDNVLKWVITPYQK